MKTLRLLWHPRLIKCLLVLVFLTNLGLIELLQRFPALPEFTSSSMTVEDRSKRERELYFFAEEKLNRAKRMISEGQVYSPYHYFADLKSISDEENRLEVKLVNIGNPVFSLERLLYESLINGLFTDEDIEKAKQPFKYYLDGGGKKGEEAINNTRQHIQQLGWMGVFYWLFLLYLKSLPLAFVLYLIWIKESQKEEVKFKFPRPFRFCLMLSIYPAILAKVIYQWFRVTNRRIWSEAELRRTKQNLFTFLSDDEVRRIKSFAQSTADLSHWRQQLNLQGLKPCHGLAIALLVTFVFVLLPKTGEANAKAKKVQDFSNVAIEQLSQHLPRMSIDNDNSLSTDNEYGKDLMTEWHNFCFLPLVRFLTIVEIVFTKQEFFQKIDHIPVSAIRPEVCLKATLTE